jgi:Trk K+ transport system NAD-binding subunit
MLAKIALGENEDLALLYEDLELKIFRVHKGSGLERKSLKLLDIPGEFQCGIVAIKRDEQGISRIDMDLILMHGDSIALIGSPERIDAFVHAYDRKPALRWVSRNKP